MHRSYSVSAVSSNPEETLPSGRGRTHQVSVIALQESKARRNDVRHMRGEHFSIVGRTFHAAVSEA